MNKNWQSHQSIMLMVAFIIGLTGPISGVWADTHNNLNQKIFRPDSEPFNKSLNEWNAEWWQFMYSIPASVNPLLDDVGEDCVVGQHGPVWFLAGTVVFTPSPDPSGPPQVGKATRNCTIPPDVALLVPVLNCEWDNLGVDPPFTLRQLRANCKENIDSTTDIFFELDGMALKNFSPYRFSSPIFNYTLPNDNLIQELGYDFGAQTVSPAVAEGYYVMVKPLSPGKHKIRSGGTNNFISLEIIYNLEVLDLKLQHNSK